MRQLPKVWDTNYEAIYQRHINEYIPDNLKLIEAGEFLDAANLASYYPFVAIMEWHLYEKLDNYFHYMALSPKYKRMDFEACLQARPTNKYSNVHDEMFYTLCSGQEQVVREYYNFVDDHFDYNEKPSNHPADWLYRVLVVLATGRYKQDMDGFLEKLIAGYDKHGRRSFIPYGKMLEAIWKKDLVQFYEWLNYLSKKYKAWVRVTEFDSAQDEVLCIWGVAICQLARLRGMKIEFDHPYIPKELIGPPILPEQH